MQGEAKDYAGKERRGLESTTAGGQDGWMDGGSKSGCEEMLGIIENNMSIAGGLREAVTAGRGVGHNSDSEPEA